MNRPQFKKLHSACLALAGVGLLGSAPAAWSANIIVNGGFETGDFTGWTATQNGVEEFTPWAVSGPGAGWFGNSSPLSGNFDAGNGFDGGSGLVYELYQDVAIPGGSSAVLTSNHRIRYDGFGITSTLDRMFEISIRDTGNTLLETLFSQSVTMNGAGDTDLGWDNNTFDVSAYAGQTVRVHLREFIPEDFTGPAHIEFDDIALDVRPASVPEGSTTLVLLGISLSGLAALRRKL